jgi:hypothetical protein
VRAALQILEDQAVNDVADDDVARLKIDTRSGEYVSRA